MAVDSLLTAAARDWAFDGERALEETSKWLWAARAEYLREMIV